MSICVVCTKGSDYARKITFSPTKVLPLPPLAPPPSPPAHILDPVLIACIDHGDSSSYGILRGVGEDTVCPL